MLPGDVPQLTSQRALADFVRRVPAWGVSLLLFTSKPGPSAVARSLSLRYKGKATVAEIPASAQVPSDEGGGIGVRVFRAGVQ